jgi:Flp pilus assembly pilin Flp
MKIPAHQAHKRQRGQATIEYTVVVMLAVIVLIAQPSIIDDVVTALKEAYTAFIYALSWSDIPLST